MADHAAAGTLSHHDRQPNGVALGMDHLDKAHQLGPVAAGPDRYQLTRAKVHGLRVVQMLCLPIAWWAAEASLKKPEVLELGGLPCPRRHHGFSVHRLAMPTVPLNCPIEQELVNRLEKAAATREQTIGFLVTQAIEQFLAATSRKASESLASDTSELAEGLAALAKRVDALEAAAKPMQEAPTALSPSPEREKVDGLLAALMAKPAPPAKG